MATAWRILTIAFLLVGGCGSGGDDDFTRVPDAQELKGTYDASLTLNGEIASAAAQVGVTTDIVILELATGALDTLHLEGSVESGGVLAVHGFESHPDRILAVTGTLRVLATRTSYRIEGTVGTIAGVLELSLRRPKRLPADQPQGAFVLAFEPSVDGSEPSARIAVTIDTTNGLCSTTGGSPVPDRNGGVLFGGTCFLAPSGAFSLGTRYRTVTPDTSPFGESFQLIGTLRATRTGIVGSGRFGLERFPPRADVFGTWRAATE